MNKNERNFWSDLILSIVFLTMIASGLSLWLAGSNPQNVSFALRDRNVLLAFHTGSGLIGLLGVVLHIKWHWFWLKALRGKSVRTLKKPVRANRIINRATWFAYILSMVFGLLSWLLTAILPAEIIKLFGSLHFASSMVCLVLLAIHLALHKKWIASAIQRYSPGLSRVGLGQ